MQADDLRAAIAVFRDMQQLEEQPGMITWCYLITSLNKARRKGSNFTETAYKLWTELEQTPELQGDQDGSYFAAGKSSSHLERILLTETIAFYTSM